MKIGTEIIFGTENPKMIIPVTIDKGFGPHLANVTKNEKSRFPIIVRDQTWYGCRIWHEDSENQGPVESRQRGGRQLFTCFHKIVHILFEMRMRWRRRRRKKEDVM